MAYDVNNEHKLTRADITALKTADSLIFDLRPDADPDGKDHHAHISCILDKSDTNPWEQRSIIPVNAYYYNYGNWYYVSSPVVVRARYWTCPRYEIIEDVLALLRVDDLLTLVWQGDNNNLLLDAVDLHSDRLLLQIRRVTAKGDWKVFKYIVATSVSLNNSARMIETRYSDYSDEFKTTSQYKELQEMRLQRLR